MRKNGDEQEIPSEDEYSKLSKVCSPLAVSLGSRKKMQKTQEQGYLRVFRLFSVYTIGVMIQIFLLYSCFHVRD